ncbi:PEP-CTERM motif protein [Planctomycetes bacterium CA13]|uniref:PEP-CTERM motif protein n=1 Tax=Novipirellula herctigrandis TaxID=2527986 RepID=A0A5C5YXJ0_9BACT|nr:PEP-CTERM motif protein [Planctomycetes bacterium CA13]
MKFATGRFIAAMALAMAFGGVAQADTFDGGGDGTSWEDALNWAADAVPLNNGSGNTLINNNHQVVFDADTWTALNTAGNLQSATQYRIARLLMGDSTAGGANGTHSLTFDFGASGASNNVLVTNGTSAVIGGRANKFSTLNIVSGITNVEANRVRVGTATGGSGTINVSGGEFITGKGGLELGNVAGGGDGTLNITGGSFASRNDVEIGDSGTFHIAGSSATVGVGTFGTTDGYWEQDAGGMLRIGLDAGGSSVILVDDVGDDGAGTQGNVVFAAGSLLDPYDLGGAAENVWTTVMTWEGTLTGAPTLSATAISSGWESQISGNDLQVRLTAVAVPEPSSFALLAIGGLAMVRRRRK